MYIMEGEKMKKTLKLILLILISIILVFNIPLYSIATDGGNLTLDGIITNGNSFLEIPTEDGLVSAPDESELQTLSNAVSGILLTIAVGVTLISAVVMGINFVVQSVEDKAKIKESMVPWIIGIVITFGAYGIWKITMGIFYKF